MGFYLSAKSIIYDGTALGAKLLDLNHKGQRLSIGAFAISPA
jgi:hypothetical protein